MQKCFAIVVSSLFTLYEYVVLNRELFLLERKSTRDEIERLERKVLSAEGALAKELEWKEKAACDIREAEQERRHAINEACRASQKADERLQ